MTYRDDDDKLIKFFYFENGFGLSDSCIKLTYVYTIKG